MAEEEVATLAGDSLDHRIRAPKRFIDHDLPITLELTDCEVFALRLGSGERFQENP